MKPWTNCRGHLEWAKVRVGGVDLNNPRMQAALTAVLALGPSPMGFGVALFNAKVQSMTGQSEADYTQRQAAYDLKKLRGKKLIAKLGRTRRYEVSLPGLRAITALLVIRDQVIKPIVAGVQSSARPTKPAISTTLDQHHEQLRLQLQPLFQDLGIAA